MFRTIKWYVFFVISLLLQTPYLFTIKKLHKQGKSKEADAYAHQVTSKWALKQVKSSGSTITVHGTNNIPKDKNVVFISNHQGNFDIALFMAYIDTPKGFVSKIEMAKVPLLSTWMKNIHCIFMDRNSLKGAATSIIEGVKLIKAGHSLVIFPEGTRSKGGPLGEFKAGSFKLATKAKAPIVPVTIEGSYQIMEQQGGKIKPAHVNLYIHPPIETSTLSKEEINALPAEVKKIIQSKLA